MIKKRYEHREINAQHLIELLLNIQSNLGDDSGRINLEGFIERLKHKSHHNRHSWLQSIYIQCVRHFDARCIRHPDVKGKE